MLNFFLEKYRYTQVQNSTQIQREFLPLGLDLVTLGGANTIPIRVDASDNTLLTTAGGVLLQETGKPSKFPTTHTKKWLFDLKN